MGSGALARKELFGLRVEVGDLLEIYVSPDARDAFGSRVSMQSGARIRHECRQAYPVPARLKLGKSGPIKFHSIRCGIHSRDEVELEVFEEFLKAENQSWTRRPLSPKAIWRNAEKQYEKQAQEIPGGSTCMGERIWTSRCSEKASSK